MPTKVTVHGQLPVHINLSVQAPVEGRSIDFNTFDILGISVSSIVGLISLSPGWPIAISRIVLRGSSSVGL